MRNRFGSTAELGIYEMSDAGMRGVLNPSEILLTQKEEQLSGIAIAATMEGMRPLLIEVQALVTQSVYGTPQRTVSGFDLRRLQLLLAVLEKRGGFQFGSKDVFLNIAGGLKVEDPSIDLAVLCALLSSYEDVPLPTSICFAGELICLTETPSCAGIASSPFQLLILLLCRLTPLKKFFGDDFPYKPPRRFISTPKIPCYKRPCTLSNTTVTRRWAFNWEDY